ncbi:hypothetical protein GCM10020367_45160 [Streptomyces sannanensis]|uniref:Peptidylprolyl isomerase n=1 Tax=Streptomyces sannanensis TaxID=285536 RepID=A0ABP6SFT3_9ACTN
MGQVYDPQSVCGEFSRISQPGSAEAVGALPATPSALAMANAGNQTRSQVFLVFIRAPCEADLASVPESSDMTLTLHCRTSDTGRPTGPGLWTGVRTSA